MPDSGRAAPASFKSPRNAFPGIPWGYLQLSSATSLACKPIIYFLYSGDMALRITNCWLTTEDFGQDARAAWFGVIRHRDAAGEQPPFCYSAAPGAVAGAACGNRPIVSIAAKAAHPPPRR